MVKFLSQASVSIKNVWMDQAGFGNEAFFVCPTLLYGNSISPKSRVFPLEYCSCFFSHGMSTIISIVTLVWSSQVYHTEHPPLLTTRWPWCRALHGLSVTAETCYFYFHTLLSHLVNVLKWILVVRYAADKLVVVDGDEVCYWLVISCCCVCACIIDGSDAIARTKSRCSESHIYTINKGQYSVSE